MRPINNFTRAMLVSGVSAAALLSMPAAAQAPAAAPAPTAAAIDESTGIDDIIVTAQRVGQSLQDVPIAVSAFTAEALEKQQIDNPSDLQLTLPNVTFTKSNFTGSTFTIRGVGDLCVGGTCDSATAIHANDLPLFGTRLFETEFFDLERVEVLRGPQGTLFGRNATAGVVNFITAKPVLGEFKAGIEGEYGNYESYKVKGFVNIPLGETLSARIAGTYLKRDGYTKNLFDNSRIDDRDQYAIRGSLRWKPSDATTVDLMGYYFRESDNRLRIQKQLCDRDPTGVLGCLPTRPAYGTTNNNSTFVGTLSSREFLTTQGGAGIGALGLGSLYGPDSYQGNVNPADPRVVNTDFTPTYFTDEIQAQARITHDFGGVSLKVSGQYQESSLRSSQDYNLSVTNRAFYAQGLNTLAAYAAGAGGAALANVFRPVANALIPGGPNGQLCTSRSDPNGVGVFGGNGVCSSTPQDFDQSSFKNKAYTGEAVLTSQFDGAFNFLLGAIYNRIETTDLDYYVNAFGIDYIAGVLGAASALGQQGAGNVTFPPVYLGTPFFRNNQKDFTLKSYGIFGEAYYNVTDTVKITVGLRYNDDKKFVRARTTLLGDARSPQTGAVVPFSATNFTGALNYAALDFDPTLAGVQEFQENRASYSEFTGRAVIDWKITDDNLLYASYSRGYKSGGINPPLSPTFQVATTFTPEFIDAFEVGSKNSFLDGTLRLNATAFYYKYKGLQTSRIVARTSVNDNVNANIYGLEIDAIVAPIRALVLNFGVSYLHTKVAQDKFLSNPRDPSGGRSDAVIVKDITNGSNCAVVPTTAGNAAGANAFVGFVNSTINAGGIPGLMPGAGLRAPTPFPANSGINGATGAFGVCGALTAVAAAAGANFGGIQVLSEGVTVNIKGNELPQSPNYKASAGIQYTADLGSGGMSIVPRFDVVLTGDSFGSIFNGDSPGQTQLINRIPSYTIMNAQIQLNGPGERWFVRGFVQNLGDSDAVTGQYVTDQSSGLFTNIFTLEPRRYGIAAGIKF